MSWSSSIVSPPDGDMAAYFKSLHLLLDRTDSVYLPGHGPKLPDPLPLVRALLTHRQMREHAIQAVLHDGAADIVALRERLYSQTDPRLRRAAERKRARPLAEAAGRRQGAPGSRVLGARIARPKPLRRLLARLLLAAVVLLMVLCGGVAAALWSTLPGTEQTAAIPGLSAAVDIRFDANDIPYIRAANALDAVAAIGFVHARDRMFQMDLMRRAASGRLSEIVGGSTLGYDRTMRTLGLAHSAEADYAALPATHTGDIGGVCARRERVDRRARAVQRARVPRAGRAGTLDADRFVAVGKDDGALVCRAIGGPSWPVRRSLARCRKRRLISSGHRATIRAARRRGPVPTRDSRRRPASCWPCCHISRTRSHCHRRIERVGGGRRAQCDWRAAAGRLIRIWLLRFPGLWYVARIDTPGSVLAGATAPGVPFLVLGRNADIAWTFTTTGADVQDVFVETPTDAGHYRRLTALARMRHATNVSRCAVSPTR